MCKSTKEVPGGKRCPAHMKGSNAAKMTAARTCKADKETVNGAFRDLRKEGKEVPAPTPEMVKAFAEMQRFSARFDSNLNNHDRRIISNAWERTAKAVDTGEVPDGSTFYAWSNLRSEVMRRLHASRARLMAIGISGALAVGMSACSGSIGEPTEPSPTSVTTTQPVKPTPTPSATPEADEWGIQATGPESTDAHGTWQRAQLADDAPALQYDASKVNDSASSQFTEEEITEAQRLLAHFSLSQYIDGIAALDNSLAAREAYAAETSPYIHDALTGWEKAALSEEDTPAVNRAARYAISQGYTPAPYKEGQTRFDAETFDLDSVYVSVDDNLGFRFKMDYTHVMEKDGEQFTLKFTGTNAAVVKKDDSGEWKLAGWSLDGTMSIQDSQGNDIL